MSHLWPVRARHGALLRLAGRGPDPVACVPPRSRNDRVESGPPLPASERRGILMKSVTTTTSASPSTTKCPTPYRNLAQPHQAL